MAAQKGTDIFSAKLKWRENLMKRVEKLLALLNPFSYDFFSLFKYFQFNFDAQNIVCILESYTIHCFSVSNLEILFQKSQVFADGVKKSICFVYFQNFFSTYVFDSAALEALRNSDKT